MKNKIYDISPKDIFTGYKTYVTKIKIKKKNTFVKKIKLKIRGVL